MGNTILNAVAIIFMFGVVGHLLVINHRLVEFMVLTDWSIVMPECGTVGDVCRVVGYIFNASIVMIAIMVYTLRWWILIAMIILWIALTSRRK